MFKKAVIAFVMLVLVFTASAQIAEDPPYFSSGVLSIDGDNWVLTPESNKQSFALGIFFGLDTIRQFMIQMEESSTLKTILEERYGETQVQGIYDLMSVVEEWAYFEVNSSDIVKILDKAYVDPDNRKYSVLDVLLVTYNKQWWSLD